MDPKASKPHSKRTPQDPDQLPSRRPNRLFLSETIPPAVHQHHPNTSQNRSHNLSDRIHEYYEKLVKSSQSKKPSPTSQRHQFSDVNLPPGYGDPYLVDFNPITVPRYSEHPHPSNPVRSALQPSNSNVRQPYTVYVEDQSGAFERFKKKQHVVNPSGHAFFDRDHAKGNESARGLRESSGSSSSSTKVPCSLCHSTSHPSQHCHLRSRIPAEHDGFLSDPLQSGSSPPTRHSKSNDENQGDGSEDRVEPSFSKKRTVPANINVHCERDVIGQEKSPVSKSHPAGSGALSTSSSNGDSVPRERKKWVRPPLVGQAASAEKSPFMSSALFDCPDDQNVPLEKRKTPNECLQLSSSTGSDPADSRDSSKVFSQSKSAYFDTAKTLATCSPQRSDEIYSGADREGNSTIACQHFASEGEQGLSDSYVGGRVSPSSSVTSNRRLEWDSGADVGYNQMYSSANADASSSGLCTIERMALAQGCSVALQLRLDPEGTTVPASTSGPTAPVPPTPLQDKAIPSVVGKPTAESTPVDQIPHIAKVLLRYRNDAENLVSPILYAQMKDGAELETLNVAPQDVELEDEQASPTAPTSKSSDSQGTTKSFKRQLSNSMQDLRKCSGNQSGNQLLKSQSDPDLSGDTPALVSRTVPSKLLKGIMRGRNYTDAAGHSISSGSDGTLVHVGTEEDLVLDADDNHHDLENPSDCQSKKGSGNAEEELGSQPYISELGSIPGLVEPGKPDKSSTQSQSQKHEAVLLQLKHTKNSTNAHVCSDSDHKRGLHHHFGVLCSSIIGGHVQSNTQPNTGSQIQNTISGPDRVYGFFPSSGQDRNCAGESSHSPPTPPQEAEILAGESTESSAFHSDAALEEHAAGTSTLTGRANSFEYLPGHMYENHPLPGIRNHQRPPGISTSTETDSEPARPISRAMHRKVVDSSSHDTEDDRLWASPRMGSNTLVQDIERGVNLLKGVMENKSAGRRCKRELIRRIIKKLVTSEYVEDVIEKERARHHVRSPFSPRKAKYQERLDRNIRLKRPVGPERQEISGESDEPKQRVPSARRKLSSQQATNHPPALRILSTLASGSKSSSLWSSQAESTSGSITLSGSSDNHKESKTSVKSNPMFAPLPVRADWLKPATQSEKLFEMRKNGASQADKHLAGLLGMHVQESVIDPVAFKNNPQKQLSWVTNEINQLKILKQLLQKQESLKQSLHPNLGPVTAMPVTGLRQTMQMADCTSPDAPESHSPKPKSARLHQWISLESDTSAGFGLSNHTGSSRDSHWRDVEVACTGEQDHHPHRTVSISDGDQVTDASCSLSNRKSDISQSSGPKIAHKSRRRSVSISDADQLLGPQGGSDINVQKKRSDCQCQKPESRAFSSRQGNVATYGPPIRNLGAEKQVCQHCSSNDHMPLKGVSLPPGAGRSAMTNRGFNSLGQPRIGVGLQQSNDQSQKLQLCTCGQTKSQIKKCCCSAVAVTGLPAQRGGAIKKGDSNPPQKMVSRIVAELPSTSTQALSGGGHVRVHIETDQEVDSAHDKTKFHQGSSARDRVRVADLSDQERAPLVRPSSDDSITKAVTEAVSTKVKALRNLGQIEEAEVKIRVKVAPSQASSDATPHSERGRVLKTQDLEDEGSFYPSKHSELDEIIARQRARDTETRQKLLAIAETRQRAQMGLHDMDRRIQDLLLEDYLSRQFKSPEMASTPHARLNVRVEAPAMQSSSVGIQSEVHKKTIGTSTSINLESSPRQIIQRPSQPPLSSKGTCICNQEDTAAVKLPQSVVSQGQQTDSPSRPQTAPTSCICSCRSQPASSPRTYHASPPYFSPDRQVEFELELHKQRPYRMSPFEVHQTLKSRNTAYFLQFEEDNSLQAEPDREIEKLPMEVVKMKIPKQKHPTAQPAAFNRPTSSQGRKGLGKVKVLQKPKSSRAPTKGVSESDVEVNLADRVVQSRQPISEPTSGGMNVLRITPGRSHLSISITDSSGESILSPEGDSRQSSYQHPSRKPHRPLKSNKRKESIHIDDNTKVGDTSQNIGGRTEGIRIPSDASSVSNMDQPGQSKRRPANDSESLYEYLGDQCSSVPTLQEYLEKNHPKYLDAAEKRRRCIAEMSYLRRLRQQSRKRLLELEGDNLRAKQKQQWKSRCTSRSKPALKKRSMPRTTKSACARRYMFLPESQQRLAELKKKEEKRTNRLMAEIYTRKLQEKVLKGTATIRSSVSVISNL